VHRQLIGIRSNTSRLSFQDGKLEFLQSCGFNCVELSFNYEADQLDWRDTDLGSWFANEKSRLGLHFTAHCPDHLQLTHYEAETARASGEELAAIASGISRFGVDRAVVHADGGLELNGEPALRKKQKMNFIDNLRVLAETCREKRVKLLIETASTNRVRFTNHLDNILSVLEAVSSPWLGVCIDTNHLNLFMSPSAGIRQAGAWLGELHCSDNHGLKEEHLMLGDGIIDWMGIAQALDDTNCSAPIVLETNNEHGLTEKEFLVVVATRAREIFGAR